MYKKKLNKILDPQLNVVEHTQSALALSNKVKLSLYKKSLNTGIPTGILEEVYRRGYSIWNTEFKGTRDQFAFDRVNSFIAGGFAADLDKDLSESLSAHTPSNKQLAKKHSLPLSQIKKMVAKGAKIEKEHSKSANTAKEIARDHLGEKPNYYKLLTKFVESEEPHFTDRNNSASRFDASDELVNIYKSDTPGQESTIKKIKRMCNEKK